MEERRPQVCFRGPLASVGQDRKVPPVKGRGPMTWGAPDRPHCPDQREEKFGEPRAEATAPQAALTLMPATISSIWSMLGRPGSRAPNPSTCHLEAPSSHSYTNAPTPLR